MAASSSSAAMTVITDEVRVRQIPSELVALLPALSRRREAGDLAPVPVPMSTRTLDHLLIVLTTAPLDAPPRDDCRARDYVQLAAAAAFFDVQSVSAFAVAELVAHLARYSDEDLWAAFAASEHTQALLDDIDFVCSRRALRNRLAAAMPERAVYWTSVGTTTARTFVADDADVGASLVAPRARARWWHFLYAAHACERRLAGDCALVCTHRGIEVRAHGAHVGTLALPFFQHVFDATPVAIDEALTKIMAARADEPGSDVVPDEALEEYRFRTPFSAEYFIDNVATVHARDGVAFELFRTFCLHLESRAWILVGIDGASFLAPTRDRTLVHDTDEDDGDDGYDGADILRSAFAGDVLTPTPFLRWGFGYRTDPLQPDIKYIRRLAAYIDLAVFYEVIVPLMSMAGTASIFISTPHSTFNFYSELTTIRDHRGELLFNTIKMGMVCRACAGTDKEAECLHPTGMEPPWKNKSNAKTKAIFGHRKTLYMREMMGKATDSESLAFGKRFLAAFFARPPAREPHESISTIYVGVDPNGGSGSAEGGTGSETAVVSFYFDRATLVITGIEHHATRNGQETRALVLAHMRALRGRKCFRHAQFVLVPEDNLANEGQEIAISVIDTIKDVRVVIRTPTRYGVRTTHQTRAAYVFTLAHLFEHQAVDYHDALVCVNPFAPTAASSGGEELAVEARREFHRQLLGFQCINDLAPSLTASKRVVFSGKTDEHKRNTASKKDDMVLALMLGVYFANEYMAGRIEYLEYKTRLQRLNAPGNVAPLVDAGVFDEADNARVRRALHVRAPRQTRAEHVAKDASSALVRALART